MSFDALLSVCRTGPGVPCPSVIERHTVTIYAERTQHAPSSRFWSQGNVLSQPSENPDLQFFDHVSNRIVESDSCEDEAPELLLLLPLSHERDHPQLTRSSSSQAVASQSSTTSGHFNAHVLSHTHFCKMKRGGLLRFLCQSCWYLCFSVKAKQRRAPWL